MVSMDYFRGGRSLILTPIRHDVPLPKFEKELMHLLCIKKARITPLHPKSDGMGERHNRTISDYISVFALDLRDGD